MFFNPFIDAKTLISSYGITVLTHCENARSGHKINIQKLIIYSRMDAWAHFTMDSNKCFDFFCQDIGNINLCWSIFHDQVSLHKIKDHDLHIYSLLYALVYSIGIVGYVWYVLIYSLTFIKSMKCHYGWYFWVGKLGQTELVMQSEFLTILHIKIRLNYVLVLVH